MLTISDLFHLDDTIAASLFAGKTYPWEVLEGLSVPIFCNWAPPFPRRNLTIRRRMSGLRRMQRFSRLPISGVLASLTMARRFATAHLSGEVRLWGRKLW